MEGDPQTAVAQLLFALIAYQEHRENYLGSCATPIILLEQLASAQDESFDLVMSSFSDYVRRKRLS